MTVGRSSLQWLGIAKRGGLWRRDVETLLERAVSSRKPWFCFPEGARLPGMALATRAYPWLPSVIPPGSRNISEVV
jgi:hypothetical protein